MTESTSLSSCQGWRLRGNRAQGGVTIFHKCLFTSTAGKTAWGQTEDTVDGLKVHSESFKKDKKEPDGCAKKEGKARKIGMSGDVYKKSVKA